MNLRSLPTLIICVFSLTVNSQQEIVTPHVDPALRFTENAGQWDPKINFRAQLDGGYLYLEKNGLVFDFYDKKKYRSLHTGGVATMSDLSIKEHCLKIMFQNCSSNYTKEVSEQGSDYENFFLGNDPNKWKGNVKNYHRITYKNLYKGINYEAITSVNGIKYNFYVKTGGDPSSIRLKYEGAERMQLMNDELKITLSINELTEKKPYAYQTINGKIIEVPCNYKLEGNTVSFEFPEGYNKKYELVIDPVLVFAAQSGSIADNFGMTATYDMGDNLISGGTVFDNGYPTTVGAYSSTFNGPAAYGQTDIVLTKYNSTGTSLIFSTYFGGIGSEIVTSLIVDASNNLYLYGATSSTNMPMAAGAYDNSFNGGIGLDFSFNGTYFTNGTDIYIAKFNPTCTSLLASTYLGGSDNDGVNHTNVISTYNTLYCTSTNTYAFAVTEHRPDSLQMNYGDQYRGEIQLDKTGNIYIASSTRSANFPTVGGFDNTLGGKQDAVIVKMNSNLSNILYSSYLGGSGNDAGYSLVVNDSNMVYVAGGTFSPDFPVQPGCYNTIYNGGKADGYVAKINAAGNAILKGTYLGTSNYDQVYFVQRDTSGNIYTYGQSLGNMPVIGSVYSNPGAHQFISRLDNQLTSLNLSTVFGSGLNKLDISPSAFAVDVCNNILLSGWGGNFIFCNPLSSMPITSGAFQTSTNGFDFYIMELSPNAASLLYGSYFGGNLSNEHVDGGTSRFDKKGVMYQSVCAGCNGNDDFPVTSGAWPNTPGNPNHSTNCNNGVFKFNFQSNVADANIITNYITGCAPLTVNFSNTSTGYTSYMWYFGPGDTSSVNLNPVKTYTTPGTYTVSLTVKNALKCNKKDSTVTFITVNSCTGVNEVTVALGEIKLFPNPAQNSIMLQSNSPIEKIVITDAIGKTVYLGNGNKNNSVPIDISSLAEGVYFVNVVSDNRSHYIKFIKE